MFFSSTKKRAGNWCWNRIIVIRRRNVALPSGGSATLGPIFGGGCQKGQSYQSNDGSCKFQSNPAPWHQFVYLTSSTLATCLVFMYLYSCILYLCICSRSYIFAVNWWYNIIIYNQICEFMHVSQDGYFDFSLDVYVLVNKGFFAMNSKFGLTPDCVREW